LLGKRRLGPVERGAEGGISKKVRENISKLGACWRKRKEEESEEGDRAGRPRAGKGTRKEEF